MPKLNKIAGLLLIVMAVASAGYFFVTGEWPIEQSRVLELATLGVAALGLHARDVKMVGKALRMPPPEEILE